MTKQRKHLKKGPKRVLLAIVIVAVIFLGCEVIEYQIIHNMERTPVEIHENTYYTARDFGLIVEKSPYDFNINGIDDYTDILNGAKIVAEINPIYISKYYAGGYPPENEGVCTDVIWRALMEAGYLLKDMMAKDIRDTYDEDVYGIEIVDDNIDFRRVGNQETFLKRYATSLTTDIEDIKEFMPGDIVTFNDSEHIAIISDKRNAHGIPYLIQNSDEEQTEKEEDVLEITDMVVTGHYRFTYNENLKELIDSL